MPRKPRENVSGAAYHVFARGAARGLLYRDDVDRQLYVARLGRTSTTFGWRCLAYCLMSNHVHLLLETTEPNLSEGMHRLHAGYAQAFNQRHDRRGHVFEGRYGAVRMESSEQLCTVAGYIARNPVEALLCRRPGEWPWSSFGQVVRGVTPEWLDARRLLSHFGSEVERALAQYARISA